MFLQDKNHNWRNGQEGRFSTIDKPNDNQQIRMVTQSKVWQCCQTLPPIYRVQHRQLAMRSAGAGVTKLRLLFVNSKKVTDGVFLSEIIQVSCGRTIRVVSVFPKDGHCSPEDKLKALIDLEIQQEKLCA